MRKGYHDKLGRRLERPTGKSAGALVEFFSCAPDSAAASLYALLLMPHSLLWLQDVVDKHCDWLLSSGGAGLSMPQSDEDCLS